MLKYQFTFLNKFKKDYKSAKKKNRALDDEFEIFLEDFEPSEGVLVSGTNGASKIRLARNDQGKSGGDHIYYYFQIEDRVYLLRLFAKSKQEELSTKEKIEIAQIIKAIKDKG
ncbi:MAG: type II toxin-antitoxin system RelE/ParE family toxin [Campylobacterota bacterium]|nr:type II toxin-antitoxin system RelE/ParE family toxin [Campylobacterota bacterium]